MNVKRLCCCDLEFAAPAVRFRLSSGWLSLAVFVLDSSCVFRLNEERESPSDKQFAENVVYRD